jgi:alpha-D-xyloside xylohydrolase
LPPFPPDIGGYSGGNPDDPTFRELIVRWFQFGFTCPLFRQHGQRPTEPWLLGDETFGNVRKVMAMRETFKSYILAELNKTAATGLPLNRPLWYDFPADANTWGVIDQYMFGEDYMMAPIYKMGDRARNVYFPAGTTWVHYFTNTSYTGGKNVSVPAPMDQFCLFKRA